MSFKTLMCLKLGHLSRFIVCVIINAPVGVRKISLRAVWIEVDRNVRKLLTYC